MDASVEYLIVVAVIAAYAAVLYGLHRQHRLGPEKALTLFGPALMIKTQRGRGALDRLGRFRRFWTVAADIGVLLAGLAMVTVVGLLLLEAALVRTVPSSAAPSPQTAIALPGINPIIPLGFGILALVVGIVLHELAHGVVARSQDVGVKSLGILWLVVPIGAFVEQDEEGFKKATRRRRLRVAAAGVLANFVLAVVFFLLLSGSTVGTLRPNADGVGIALVVPNTAAANNSLAAGDIITSINGTPTPTENDLLAALENTTPGERVTVTYAPAGSTAITSVNVVLGTRPGNTTGHKIGFLGIEASLLTPRQLVQELSWPPSFSGGGFEGTLLWLILPLGGLEPVGGSTLSYFHLVGPLAAIGPAGFWLIANSLYWLAWMNLLLGISNALPIVPFDGGILFKEFATGLLARVRKGWDEARLEAAGTQLAVVSSLVLVFLIVWLFVGPYL